MTDKERNENLQPEENEVELVEQLDNEALDVVFRLYDKTIKDLVDR